MRNWRLLLHFLKSLKPFLPAFIIISPSPKPEYLLIALQETSWGSAVNEYAGGTEPWWSWSPGSSCIAMLVLTLTSCMTLRVLLIFVSFTFLTYKWLRCYGIIQVWLWRRLNQILNVQVWNVFWKLSMC